LETPTIRGKKSPIKPQNCTCKKFSLALSKIQNENTFRKRHKLVSLKLSSYHFELTPNSLYDV